MNFQVRILLSWLIIRVYTIVSEQYWDMKRLVLISLLLATILGIIFQSNSSKGITIETQEIEYIDIDAQAVIATNDILTSDGPKELVFSNEGVKLVR